MAAAGDHLGGGPPRSGEIERLIERGLHLYGTGDVDGALALWEEALRLDPEDVRAGAYVDYVRENYPMLMQAPQAAPDEPSFGLAAEPGDEASRGDTAEHKAVERYIESVDEGWSLDAEPGPPSGVPARPPTYLELDEPPPTRAPAPRVLPLPAHDEPGLTLELEAEEADEVELAVIRAATVDDAGDEPPDEKTGDYSRHATASSLAELELEFGEQRSVATRELTAPRGYVRPALEPVPAPGARRRESEPPDETGDDRLRTRPGRTTGSIPLDPLERTNDPLRGFAPDVLASLTPFAGQDTGLREVGPEERTREGPVVRVTFAPDADSQELPDPAFGGEEEWTSERRRHDSASEPTSERAPRETRPAPLDAASPEASGTHPPLVIIEDPGLAPPPDAGFGQEEPTSAGTRRRRPSSGRRPAAISGGPSPTPLDDIAVRLEAALDAAVPIGDAPAERTRRRINELIDRAADASRAGDHATAIIALDLALREEPDSAVAQKAIHRHQPAILDIYQRYLGDLGARPTLAMPMHELADQKVDIRAAFLLSRIDGTLTFEEILDVSGMQRAEAFRHLSLLLLRGILQVR